ncbi:MAG: sirohydrochlorin cobaltochelatase [Clostridiales bacterium]|nr:sirohydrochlorin cobaltochelatase [Clostridiales bacterium]
MERKHAKLVLAALLAAAMLAGCGSAAAPTTAPAAETAAPTTVAAPETTEAVVDDQAAADAVAELIDAIYVQQRTDDTDAQCAAAKAGWDALTDAQKELVEGENADPDYFGRDTGDASLDDPLNADGIGEKEILVVSFGTSFNDSRVADIKGIEDAIQAAFPDWSVRRAFTAQIIINHVQARDGEAIDNMDQALERAVANGVKELVVQPTHLMHGAEYDEMMEALEGYKDKIEKITVAEPLLGEVGSDAAVINADKEVTAKAVVAAAAADAGFADAAAAADAGTAFVLMGHGTAHVAKVTYSQMQTQMDKLGYDNVFIGTVEGEPEETSCEAVIEAVKAAGYKNVILRPLMVVAGDHANNDMAGEEEDSWKSMFQADGGFDSVTAQIAGLGSIPAVQELYVAHTKAVIG